MANQRVFVLVPGLPAWGLTDHFYWDTLTFDSQWVRELNAKLVLVEPGPISSHHDRACEVFAQLYGITTDFGEEHSKQFQHSRFGRNFENSKNFKTVWSEENPFDFICHSAGINTVRYLQYLLANDFWGMGTSDKWIRSVVSINGNLNGTQFTHFFGIDTVNGSCSKKKLLKAAKRARHAVVWAINREKGLTDEQKCAALNWHLDHFNITSDNKVWYKEMDNESSIFSNFDNLFYDSSIQGSARLNATVPSCYPSTYYFGFYGQATNVSGPLPISPQLNPVLFNPSAFVLHYKIKSEKTDSDEYPTDEWRNNDGVCPVASQTFPVHSQQTVRLTRLSTDLKVQKGFWNYGNLQELIGCKCVIDHFTMVWGRTFLKPQSFQLKSNQQKQFYFDLLSFVNALD